MTYVLGRTGNKTVGLGQSEKSRIVKTRRGFRGREMLILKMYCLFIGLAYTYLNTLNWVRTHTVEGCEVAIQFIGITVFITLQWLI
jgi:hypothetical protein